MPQLQYFDRSGRQLSKREALEADGSTLRDGVSLRVHTTLRDGCPPSPRSWRRAARCPW
jgi:hypothetical protein